MYNNHSEVKQMDNILPIACYSKALYEPLMNISLKWVAYGPIDNKSSGSKVLASPSNQSPTVIRINEDLFPLLLTWVNFNPSMDK